jgi:UPF0755 protein
VSQLGLDMRPLEIRDRRPAKYAVAGSLGFLLAIVAGIVGYFVVWATQTNDYKGSGYGTISVVVYDGESLRAIGRTLQKDDVVKSATLFTDSATGDPRAGSIAPGSYKMAHHMSSVAALNRLFDPTARQVSRMLIPEGRRLDETLRLAAKATGLALTDFQNAITTNLGLPGYAGSNPEGFLFPATYSVPPGTSARLLLRDMVSRYIQAANDVNLEARAAKDGISPYEAVIVASILEAEAYPTDYPKVARVIYNRLQHGMRLQLDSTVNYALGTSLIHLTPAQLATRSPYNTYLHSGLPPTPIDSPGQAALDAALSPAAGPWLYFLTVDPVNHITKFASTLAEFQSLQSKYGKLKK